jgi:conjugative relaxase-like TrwC/TraI family protein
MSVSAEGAEKYLDEALKRSDYCAKELGVWGGKGADRLGLKGEVTCEEFLALAPNRVPGTEENLTVRTKDERTAGYDFCYSVPKSVSVYLALSSARRSVRQGWILRHRSQSGCHRVRRALRHLCRSYPEGSEAR